MKNRIFKSSIICILVGFCLMYWSGIVSDTTNDNWQGITGIIISVLGASLACSIVVGNYLK
jgi:ABC-type Fe3+-siderophore transport system permease subunit